MSSTATLAPSRAKVSAITFPKPDPPPVTMATLSRNRMTCSLNAFRMILSDPGNSLAENPGSETGFSASGIRFSGLAGRTPRQLR